MEENDWKIKLEAAIQWLSRKWKMRDGIMKTIERSALLVSSDGLRANHAGDLKATAIISLFRRTFRCSSSIVWC